MNNFIIKIPHGFVIESVLQCTKFNGGREGYKKVIKKTLLIRMFMLSLMLHADLELLIYGYISWFGRF